MSSEVLSNTEGPSSDVLSSEVTSYSEHRSSEFWSSESVTSESVTSESVTSQAGSDAIKIALSAAGIAVKVAATGPVSWLIGVAVCVIVVGGVTYLVLKEEKKVRRF